MLELVVVLVVIAVASAIAIPRMSSASSRYSVRAAAFRLASELDAAAERARASSTPHTMVFSASTGESGLFQGTPDNTRGGALKRLSFAAAPYNCRLIVLFAPTPDRIGFDAFGRSTNAGVVAAQRGDYLVAVTSPLGAGVSSVGSLQLVPRIGMGSSVAIGNSLADATPLGTHR